MEAPRHTPGPWLSHDVTDEHDPDCGSWIVAIPGRPNEDQATVHRLYFGDMENNTGEDIANANLVAAAPDLLAALVELNKRAEYVKHFGVTNLELVQHLVPAILQARSAIIKAGAQS